MEFKPVDQIHCDSIREDAVAENAFLQSPLAKKMEPFGYVFHKALRGLFIDRRGQNEGITAKFMNEDQFRDPSAGIS